MPPASGFPDVISRGWGYEFRGGALDATCWTSRDTPGAGRASGPVTRSLQKGVAEPGHTAGSPRASTAPSHSALHVPGCVCAGRLGGGLRRAVCDRPAPLRRSEARGPSTATLPSAPGPCPGPSTCVLCLPQLQRRPFLREAVSPVRPALGASASPRRSLSTSCLPPEVQGALPGSCLGGPWHEVGPGCSVSVAEPVSE